MAESGSAPESSDHSEQQTLDTKIAKVQITDSQAGAKRKADPSPEGDMNPPDELEEPKRRCPAMSREERRSRLQDMRKMLQEQKEARRQQGRVALTYNEHIYRSMQRQGHDVFGFKIYRLTYDDDEQWEKFMKMLDDEARLCLTRKNEPEGTMLAEMLDWALENDKKWDAASFAQVREHFKNVREEEMPKYRGCPRYQVCVAVDKECLTSAFINGHMKDSGRWSEDPPFVKALEADFSEDAVRLEELEDKQIHYEILRESQEACEEDKDEDWIYEPDHAKVGYLKIPFRLLAPTFYRVLDAGFDELYHRGPKPPKLWQA